MTSRYTGREQREYTRHKYHRPIRYSRIGEPYDRNLHSAFTDAIAKNVSISGISFLNNLVKVPSKASLVALDIDYKTMAIRRKIEERSLIVEDKIIGKVVRVEDNKDGTCGIGVAFVTRTDAP